MQASERDGQAAVLLAADTHTVDALNTRAHEDRVLAGLVSPEVLPSDSTATGAKPASETA